MDDPPTEGRTGEKLLSNKVRRMVATFKGMDPTELKPLRRAVNPHALDSIFSTTDGADRQGQLSFVYENCEVIISSGDYVRIQDLEGITSIESAPSRP